MCLLSSGGRELTHTTHTHPLIQAESKLRKEMTVRSQGRSHPAWAMSFDGMVWQYLIFYIVDRITPNNGSGMWGTSPNGAHPGLHSKPMDAAIGQVPAPYRLGSRHGNQFEMKNTKH